MPLKTIKAKQKLDRKNIQPWRTHLSIC